MPLQSTKRDRLGGEGGGHEVRRFATLLREQENVGRRSLREVFSFPLQFCRGEKRLRVAGKRYRAQKTFGYTFEGSATELIFPAAL